MSRRALVTALAVVLATLLVPAQALSSEQAPTLAEVENEVYCPTCKTLLAISNAPVADRMRAFIVQWIADGDTKSEIKAKLVAQFGEAVLAAPPKEGFNLLAWVLPFAGLGIAGAAIAFLAVRWTRASGAKGGPGAAEAALNGGRRLDPDLERRLDEELARFDRM